LDSLSAQRSVLQGVCGFANYRLALDIDGALRSSEALEMSGGCFPALGLHAEIGRTLSPGDDQPGGEHVAMLTHEFWQSSFGKSPDMLGRKVRIQGSVFTVVGVAQPDFRTLEIGFNPAVLIPLSQTPGFIASTPARPLFYWVDILARRAPGMSQRAVQARLGTLARPLLETSVPLRYNAAQRRDYVSRRVEVSSAANGINLWYEGRFSAPLYIILGICACVLLLACVNISSLLLVRVLRREHEFGLRLALGASRGNIASLLVFESWVLVLLGSLAGFIVAQWARSIIAGKMRSLFSIDLATAVDSRAIAMSAALTVTVLVIFALLSISYAGRMSSLAITPSAGRGVIGDRARAQKVLLCAQLALTLALVACGGMLGLSFDNVNSMPLGIATEGVSQAILAPAPGARDRLSTADYYQDLLRSFESVPGVASAALSDYAPLLRGDLLEAVRSLGNSRSLAEIRAQPVLVSARFFETLGIPIVAGEGFGPSTNPAAEPAAVISQSLATLLGNRTILGQYIELGDEGSYQRVKIIGVARDARLSLVHPENLSQPAMYLNVWDHLDALRSPVLLIGAPHRPPLEQSEVARLVSARGRHYVESYITLANAKDEALAENRALAYLARAFAVFAIALAAVGLFGLLSFFVTAHTREIGLRVALGATPSNLVSLFVRQLVPIIAAGSIAGVALTLVLGKLASSMIFGLSVYDPKLLALSVLILALTAALAAWLPTRRATSVDPLRALREE
jgi:putative ABC transport system permease protein